RTGLGARIYLTPCDLSSYLIHGPMRIGDSLFKLVSARVERGILATHAPCLSGTLHRPPGR
ncbi:MAG TPA: hypothetical protein PLV85_17510, partial [Polyangiaceae bacterium]|nr:hypothetical protein [Polyangiaceae bacterium]